LPKILATADLHGTLPEIPDCDVLIIAGDVCPDHPIGKKERYSLPDNGSDFQLDWLDQSFRPWLSDLGERGIRVIGIAGNHDFVFERLAEAVDNLFLPWTYLRDEGTLIGDISVWGTPWVPGLPRWAFHGTERALELRLDVIPSDVDILIAHGPPYGILDFVAPQFGSLHVGDRALRERLVSGRLRPRVVVCGHIHEQYGIDYVRHANGDTTTVLNVSHNTENYEPVNPVVEIYEFSHLEEEAA
jgi:Icc-related predicted phosphoesterase